MQKIQEFFATKNSLQEIIDFILCLENENTYTTKPIHIFLLQGEVGMGKSTLVEAYCNARNIQSSSPTFAFLHEYEHGIYHYDLYLKHDSYSLMRLYESLGNKGIHFVEWGDRGLFSMLENMGFSCAFIEIISTHDANERKYIFWA